jgi:hypothetical protein
MFPPSNHTYQFDGPIGINDTPASFLVIELFCRILAIMFLPLESSGATQ